MSTTLYTGPAASAMNGTDLSWIVGLVITVPLYYLLAVRQGMRRQDRFTLRSAGARSASGRRSPIGPRHSLSRRTVRAGPGHFLVALTRFNELIMGPASLSAAGIGRPTRRR